VVKKKGKNSAGGTEYSVTLYAQNVVALTGTAFSGGVGTFRAVDPGAYRVLGARKEATPSYVVESGNELALAPSYGMQKIPAGDLPWQGNDDVVSNMSLSWGFMRARLNPMSTATTDRGLYYHGQLPGAPHPGTTHGCLSYGEDATIINKIWGMGVTVPVSVDENVKVKE